jgi:ATP-dependent protease ClpP protease subunit
MRKFIRIDPKLSIEKLDEVFDEPKIIRVNEFDEEALEDFEKDFDEAHMTGQPVIPIVIDSYGGSAYGLLGMVAAIEQARVPVATVLTSKAMSAGTLLFCFGTEGYRYMHPDAQMMIHDGATWTAGKVEEIKADARHLEHLNKIVYKKASRHIGHDSNYLLNLIREKHHVDWFLTAKEAKKHNIANHLRIPCFDVEISLKISFG